VCDWYGHAGLTIHRDQLELKSRLGPRCEHATSRL